MPLIPKSCVPLIFILILMPKVSSFAADLVDHSVNSQNDVALATAATESQKPAFCNGADGARIQSEIQGMVLQYESNLISKNQNNPTEQARMSGLREVAKNRLLSLMSRYDLSCFIGIADPSVLCAELAYDHSIKTPEGLSIPFQKGYTLKRRILANGKYSSAWALADSKGEVLALAGDKDKDGMLDYVFLSGAYTTTTSSTTRKVMGINYTVDDTSPAFGPGSMTRLKSEEAYAPLFGPEVPAARTCALAGDPTKVMGLVASDKKWNPRNSQITWDKKLALLAHANSEGFHTGVRGLLKGVEAAGVGTWKGLTSMVTGPWAYATNSQTRTKVNAAVAHAFEKAGAGFSKIYSDCTKEHNGAFAPTLMCVELRANQAELAGAGHVLSSIGAQLKKCWTGEGAEFQNEYFSECMGQIVFYAGTSIVGAGMVQGGAKAATTSASAAVRVAGRTSAILGEWVVDQTGLGTIGANKITKLKEALKGAHTESQALVDAGKLALSPEESQVLSRHLQDSARAAVNGAAAAPSPLPETLLKKINDADSAALARWKHQATDALSDAPPKAAEWVPSNQPNARHAGLPEVPDRPVELPGFLDQNSKGLTKHGVIFGPNDKFDAAFNPTAFVAKDKAGKEKVYLVIRGEKNVTDPTEAWKRKSLPYLAESDDGKIFKMVQEEPLMKADLPIEMKGGIEDCRYIDLRKKPALAPDGKTFDGMYTYTAFDGKTARVAYALFNHDKPLEIRKMGALFSDADVIKNPLIPDNPAWTKSAVATQFLDPKTGEVRLVMHVGEGNLHHGGVMAIEAKSPLDLKWPATQKPVVTARKGFYDEGLVEPAFSRIGPLPADLAAKTGQKDGLYLMRHGDGPPKGYQVGFDIFSLDNATGKPIYQSSGPFLSPTEQWEIEGQVGKVVFATGGVEKDGEFLVYYGAGDSRIGVASAPLAKPVGSQAKPMIKSAPAALKK